MTHGKKSKTIYTDLKYNRYMTDDRNRKSGNPVSKFCIQDNCNNEAIYNHWGMKPKYCIDHKKDYHVNIYENPVSKFCDYNNCKKTARYNFWGMRPRYCFDHKDKYHVNTPKKHILCYKHFISHSRKTECPKCKIKKSPKCDECNITASYNFPKLRPLKCLKHRKKGMVNIKRNHILCKIHDISHSKKSGCKKCKLDIDNYDTSSKHMQDKIFKNFHNDLIEKIKKKFTNYDLKEIYTNILNNSTDKKYIKFKLIENERDRLDHVRNLKLNKSDYPIKSEVNDLYNITINLNKSIRKIYNRFKETNYKYITDYIENEFNIDIMEYKILKKKINSIYLKIDKIIKNKKEADNKKYKEDLEKRKLEDKLKEKERLEKYNKNQEKNGNI